MKLSNIVTRISYILVLIYLCYITYKHIDICSNNLEEFIDTGSSLSNLLKESVLSTFSKVDYSNLIDYSWGTKSEDVEKVDNTKIQESNTYETRNILHFNIINPNVLSPEESSKNKIIPTTIAPTTISPTTISPTTIAPETTLSPRTISPDNNELNWANWEPNMTDNIHSCENECYTTA